MDTVCVDYYEREEKEKKPYYYLYAYHTLLLYVANIAGFLYHISSGTFLSSKYKCFIVGFITNTRLFQ